MASFPPLNFPPLNFPPLKLKPALKGKMNHVVVPDNRPPKGYSCKICGNKALVGQAVIMDPTGLADKPCCVMHVTCVKLLIASQPEVLDGSSKAVAKREKQEQEEAKISSEFETLREKYATIEYD